MRRLAIFRIIIVDDHPILRDALTTLIAQRSEGQFQVVGTAANADEALALIKASPSDMVILDISLDGLDGIELIKTIRSLGHPVKILVLSMYDESLYAERALDAGAEGYVMKQQEPSEVFGAICSVAAGNIYFSRRILRRLMKRDRSIASADMACGIDVLTDRELETFRLLGQGWKTRRIADELHLSIKTVERYSIRIRQKLGLESPNALIVHAAQWVSSRAGVPHDTGRGSCL